MFAGVKGKVKQYSPSMGLVLTQIFVQPAAPISSYIQSKGRNGTAHRIGSDTGSTCGKAHVARNYTDYAEDTTLAWLMPTNTAMHLMTLAHSLLNLWGSPRWLSRQGYSRPTTAARRNTQTRISQDKLKICCVGLFEFP